MLDNGVSFKRWYDEDNIVSRCVGMLENLQDSLKRQTATYLMDEIISKPPYSEMLPDDIFTLITSENRKRRWYDFDEVTRIFIELLRHSNAEMRKEIAIMAIKFIEGATFNGSKSVEIEIKEEDRYL